MSELTLDDVIDRWSKRPLPHSGKEGIRQRFEETVKNLIGGHYDKKQLDKETWSRGLRWDELSKEFTRTDCQSYLEWWKEGDADTDRQFAQRLLSLTASLLKDQPLLCVEDQTMVENIIQVIQGRQAASRSQFHLSSFRDVLVKGKAPPVLWSLLDKAGLLPMSLTMPTLLALDPASLSQQLLRMLTSGKFTENHRCQAVQDIMVYLVEHAFPDKRDEDHSDLRKACEAVLDKLIIDFLEEGEGEEGEVLSPVTALSKSSKDDDFTLTRKLCSHALTLMFSHFPTFSVKEALRLQKSWLSLNSHSRMRDLCVEVCLPFEVDDLVPKLLPELEKLDISYPCLLSLISALILSFRNADARLAELLRGRLRGALEEGDWDRVGQCFLVARHCCSLGRHLCEGYADWFGRTFRAGRLSHHVADSQKSFTFLIQFLTSILPFESAEYLRAHILSSPTVPPQCQCQLIDYRALARSQLDLLKEPLIVEYEEDSSEDKKDREQAEAEVEKALVVFASTGKVPSSVMESSIFRRNYFRNRFLPVLLKPRALPDRPDAQMKLIAALVKADKVPKDLQAQYQIACRMETARLQKGVHGVQDEGDKEDSAPSVWEQLRLRLRQLMEADAEAASSRINELISGISQKITEVMDSTPPDASRVVETVLDTMCAAIGASKPLGDHLRLRQLVLMLRQHLILHPVLFSHLESLLTVQLCELQAGHVRGLAAMLSLLSLLEEGGQAEGSSKTRQPSATACVERVLKAVPTSNSAQQTGALRLFSDYLGFVFLMFEKYSPVFVDEDHGFVPDVATKRFLFLSWRRVEALRPGSASEETWEVEPNVHHTASALLRSKKFSECSAKLGFRDWIQEELKVSLLEDYLPHFARRKWHMWGVWSHFLPLPEAEGGCGNSISQAASTLMEELISALNKESPPSPCPSCEAQNDQTVFPLASGLTWMLQELTQGLGREGDAEAAGSWMLQQLVRSCQTEAVKSGVAPSSRVFAALRVAYTLPAYLLYRDRPNDPCTLTPLTSALHQHLGPAVMETCYLPEHLFSYMMQGFCSLDWTSSLEQAKTFLSSPVVAASLMVHWTEVRHFCQTVHPTVFEEVSSASNWAHRCVTRQEPPPEGLSAELLSSALFALFLSRTESEKVMALLTAKVLEDSWKRVMIPLLKLLLVHFPMDEQDPRYQPTLSTVVREAVTRVPDLFVQPVLGSARAPPVQREPPGMAVVMETTESVRTINLLKLVVTVGEEGVRGIAHREGGLRALLSLYHRAKELWVCMRVDIPCSSPQTGQVRVTQLEQVCQLIKVAMETAPLSHLASVSQEMLKSCGVDFCNIHQKRVKARR